MNVQNPMHCHQLQYFILKQKKPDKEGLEILYVIVHKAYPMEIFWSNIYN